MASGRDGGVPHAGGAGCTAADLARPAASAQRPPTVVGTSRAENPNSRSTASPISMPSRLSMPSSWKVRPDTRSAGPRSRPVLSATIRATAALTASGMSPASTPAAGSGGGG
jgi:hypothetical protein